MVKYAICDVGAKTRYNLRDRVRSVVKLLLTIPISRFMTFVISGIVCSVWYVRINRLLRETTAYAI